MEKIRTNSQNKILHALLGQLNIPNDVKEDLVYQFTDGKEKRSSGMNPEQCQALINHLNMLKSVAAMKPARGEKNAAADKMRKKVLSLCHEMNLKLENGKIDMGAVNAMCIDRGHKHKPLDEYTLAELPLLITQFERITRDYLKGLANA